jgi:hypothetical protein
MKRQTMSTIYHHYPIGCSAGNIYFKKSIMNLSHLPAVLYNRKIVIASLTLSTSQPAPQGTKE